MSHKSRVTSHELSVIRLPSSVMKLSNLFGTTLRAAPADVDAASHQLLLRAGYVRQIAAGIFAYLPLAHRTLKKIEQIIREEMNHATGQEMLMPVVHPAELWQRSGRWQSWGDEMVRFKDRRKHDWLIAPTHEEAVAVLASSEISSYRQLPQLVYQFQTKFRDEPRPRAGLIRTREFVMKDAYSLDRNEADLQTQYATMYQVYQRIFERCGLPARAVNSAVGNMGGSKAHEFHYLTDIGEDTLALCDHCQYGANLEVAEFKRTPFRPAPDFAVNGTSYPPEPMQKVETPHTATIDDLATLLQIDKRQTAKAVFFTGEFADQAAKLIFCVVRGDDEVNEGKVMQHTRAKSLRAATTDEIAAVGAVPGYASPIGIDRSKALVVVDWAVQMESGLVAGANEAGYHLLHTQYGRDYTADLCVDIASVYDGAICDCCGQPLKLRRGVEIGNIFQLGTRYTEALNARYTDEQGKGQLVWMGSYGIGLGRLMACIAEEHHDDKGLCWPTAIAPYQVMLVSLAKTPEIKIAADQLYADLQAAGIEVLYDDRDASPGVKFGDADLIGAPIRITLGDRSLKNGGAELKTRRATESTIIPLDHVIHAVRQ